ncbi:uncharacterized protein SPAPADRAFT_58148 [Spathaspora passalidarum NRRL Y-27907]|uniref:PQ-loop repeat-containing protein 1 n=1 Tax=Spathaspora passalidarum (strain NRRL Y-27907 / 11-Y1) TaxID=619300 RepID=G3AFM8_SPAPN|nr:uncharacterized protein SPAPADRAFT_58148 [Spathaspora passalidarum NRRL Y-27907]EGW35017.1 hypothetical protein SPAPADRAFT_58148 [Spathaspora passalidarum NRRL Y-27907]
MPFLPDDYLPYLEYLPDLQKCANIFMTFTPLFSYGSTCYSIHRTKSSSGFSLDICCTMLMASILRVYYYMCSPFEITLLRQSIVMIFIQCILLKVGLKYRSQGYDPDFLTPMPVFQLELTSRVPRRMSSAHAMKHETYWMGDWLSSVKLIMRDCYKFTQGYLSVLFISALRFFDVYFQRPGHFWQWKHEKPYWVFVVSFMGFFATCTLFLHSNTTYASTIGILGLFIESLLPLPQILLLNRLKSVENFKVILLLSWLGGDCIKISYLLYGTNDISIIFILAGLFQMSLDIYIATQYIQFKYGKHEQDIPLQDRSIDDIVFSMLEEQKSPTDTT